MPDETPTQEPPKTVLETTRTETTVTEVKPRILSDTADGGSNIMGISVRAIIVTILVTTLCAIECWNVMRLGKTISNEFLLIVGSAVSWYYGQRSKAP